MKRTTNQKMYASITETSKGKPAISTDGYLYRLKKVGATTKNWYCVHKSCNAKITTPLETTEIIHGMTSHNHSTGRGGNRIQVNDLKQSCKKRKAEDDLTGTPRKIVIKKVERIGKEGISETNQKNIDQSMAESKEICELRSTVEALTRENELLEEKNLVENEEIFELQSTVEVLTRQNALLQDRIIEMESGMLELEALRLQDQEHKQEEDRQQEVKCVHMATKYADRRFLTSEEKKDIEFEIFSRYLEGNAQFKTNLEPGIFRFTTVEGDIDKPVFAFIKLKSGRFTTPTAGDYRFDVSGIMWCYNDEEDTKAKAEWYICHIPQQDDYVCSSSDDDYDDDLDEKEREERKKKEEEREEKNKSFVEKKKRHLLFTMDANIQEGKCSVGFNCDKGTVFWIEVVVLGKGFNEMGHTCMFEGRLVH